MTDTRDNILNRLRTRRVQAKPLPPAYRPWRKPDPRGKLVQFSECMRAVHTEVIELQGEPWQDWVRRALPARNLQRVVVGDHPAGRDFAADAGDMLEVKTYAQAIENWKPELFNNIEVGITGTLAGIAETGSLVLWPDATEPRLMSLVPPVHIALLDAERIYQNLASIIEEQNWANGMSTNALLISGPSKTADIEQTLAYGIHGPQQLIVLVS